MQAHVRSSHPFSQAGRHRRRRDDTATWPRFAWLAGAAALGACAVAWLFWPGPTRTVRSASERRAAPSARPRTSATAAREVLVRSFESLEEAQALRERLVESGVPAEAIELRVLQDEAGPTEGNFLIGNGRTTHGGAPGPVLAGNELPYEHNFAHTVTRGAHLLLVRPIDADMRERAQRTLEGSGGVDPVARGQEATQRPTRV